MNPLSAWTFNRRHKGHAALLLSLILLVTVGLFMMGAVVWGVFIEPARLSNMVLSKFSLVTPASGGNSPNSTVMTRIQTNPDIERIIPTISIPIDLASLFPGESATFRLLGLEENDLHYVMERFNATLKEGQVFRPGTNGLLLSEEVAAILGVEVGDSYEMISVEFYGDINTSLEATMMEVVGILESDIYLGFLSLEFLNNIEQYNAFPARFLITAQENRASALDDFLRNEIQGTKTEVQTLKMLRERLVSETLPGIALLIPGILIVTTAFALVIVVINKIANLQRLPELGILHATGHSKKWLIRRWTAETATMTTIGWIIGIGCAMLILHILNVSLFIPQGHHLGFVVLMPLALVTPIPAVVIGFTTISVRRTLNRLDSVAIVEQGDLSQEREQNWVIINSKSSPNPLSSTTYYRRHKRQVSLIISLMGLITFSVNLFIFILGVSADAEQPLLGYLHRVSIVRSPGISHDLDPNIAARVKAHPSVERVIPVAPRFHMVNAWIPPFSSGNANPFAVYAEDMDYLIELYDLELIEGHLPHSGSNEMVIPETLAQNRGIGVGDVIGDPEHPAYPGAEALPSPFVISGIFARPSSPEDENWWGFISLEFIETNDIFPLPGNLQLIVVSKEGQKGILDDWLEKDLAGMDASVLTFRQENARLQQNAQNQIISMVIMQSIIAIIAAIGLAVLYYFNTSQRQVEFGILHTVGYSRRYLVSRMFRETIFTTMIAWGVSAALILILMIYLRFGVYQPIGLTFNLLKLTPWLYTLPIPVAVLAANTGTTAWTLSKLDPITIIDKRS